VIDLARKRGIKVTERAIMPEETDQGGRGFHRRHQLRK